MTRPLDLRDVREQIQGVDLELSFRDFASYLREQLEAIETPEDDSERQLRVVAVFSDRVVYRLEGTLFARDYSLSAGDGAHPVVSFGERRRVRKRSMFEPVEEAGLRESTELEEIEAAIPEGEPLREARVDEQSGRISDVALLGRVSKNDRIYTEQAMKEAAQLYQGARVYLDHPTDRELKRRDGVRSVRDLVGRIQNPRHAGDRVRGDIDLIESPDRDRILSLAQKAPELVGASHRARGEVCVRGDGTQVVESLETVHAIELVTEPATVSGLNEAAGGSSSGRRRDLSLEEAHDELFGFSW